MKNLVIICGGVSAEHEISIRSTRNILQAVDRSKYNVLLIGIAKSGKWYQLSEEDLGEVIDDRGDQVMVRPGSSDCFLTSNGSLGPVDIIFPVLHGPNGEDGTVQGMFELLNVPYVGPGVLGSSVSMDKDVAKRLLKYASVPVAKWITVRRDEKPPNYIEVTHELGPITFVKPANMGSSVGVSRVTNEEELERAYAEAFKHDNKVLIEESIKGRELECAVKGNQNPLASGVGEVQSGEFYSYSEKYDSGSVAEVIIPAEVSAADLSNLRNIAIRAYKALGCEGLARVDMFLTTYGEVLVNEVNTMPGFTSISMYPKLWEEEGIEYSRLIDELVDLAIERHRSK